IRKLSAAKLSDHLALGVDQVDYIHQLYAVVTKPVLGHLVLAVPLQSVLPHPLQRIGDRRLLTISKKMISKTYCGLVGSRNYRPSVFTDQVSALGPFVMRSSHQHNLGSDA